MPITVCIRYLLPTMYRTLENELMVAGVESSIARHLYFLLLVLPVYHLLLTFHLSSNSILHLALLQSPTISIHPYTHIHLSMLQSPTVSIHLYTHIHLALALPKTRQPPFQSLIKVPPTIPTSFKIGSKIIAMLRTLHHIAKDAASIMSNTATGRLGRRARFRRPWLA